MKLATPIKLRLPYPPSANRYYRHVPGLPKPIISKEGRLYRQDVIALIAARGQRFMLTCRLAVVIVAVMPDRRRRDLANIEKCLLDSLQHAGVYEDDYQRDDLRTVRGHVEPPGAVFVSIEVIQDGQLRIEWNGKL